MADPRTRASSDWRRIARRGRAAVLHPRRAAARIRSALTAPPSGAGRATGTRTGTAAANPVGMVEKFDQREIVGWVAAPPEAFPLKVSLCVNGYPVQTTWADKPSSRRGRGDVRSFHLELSGIWQFTKAKNRLTVRVAGRPLPIAGEGLFRKPRHDGEFDLDELKSRLSEGQVFSHAGWLQLSKKLDVEWQRTVVGMYHDVARIVAEKHGYEPFVVYGSLLGQVREGGFIGHDNDFDAAYLSSQTDGASSAAEMKQIALTLVEAGYDVTLMRTAIHIYHPEKSRVRIDLFHVYADESGEIVFPFGIAGSSTLTRADWTALVEASLAGHPVMIPANAERVVEHLYGPRWRVPDPGFHWEWARKKWEPGAFASEAMREEVYWANFYARHEFREGSSFFELVNGRDDLPTTVLDIGCGDGRDTFAFAAAGRRALGIDRSTVGIEHAGRKAESAGLADRLSFLTCDVGDEAGVRAAVRAAREASGDAPVVFYLRFFLHSIPEEVQEVLMRTLAEAAGPGDVFAAEFRTDKDAANAKAFGSSHYRRYQNAAAFSAALRERYGWDVEFETESTGLSPYGEEDPVLYRVIATRS